MRKPLFLLSILSVALCLQPAVGSEINGMIGDFGPGPGPGPGEAGNYLRQDAEPDMRKQDLKPVSDPFESELRHPYGNNIGDFGPHPRDSGPPWPQPQPILDINSTRSGASKTDPDTSDEIQLKWGEWHEKVDAAINERFNSSLPKTLPETEPKNAQLLCEVAFVVSDQQTVPSIRLLRKSPSFVFNARVIWALKSMTANPVLAFPIGTRRDFVEVTTSFSKGIESGLKPGTVRYYPPVPTPRSCLPPLPLPNSFYKQAPK